MAAAQEPTALSSADAAACPNGTTRWQPGSRTLPAPGSRWAGHPQANCSPRGNAACVHQFEKPDQYLDASQLPIASPRHESTPRRTPLDASGVAYLHRTCHTRPYQHISPELRKRGGRIRAAGCSPQRNDCTSPTATAPYPGHGLTSTCVGTSAGAFCAGSSATTASRMNAQSAPGIGLRAEHGGCLW